MVPAFNREFLLVCGEKKSVTIQWENCGDIDMYITYQCHTKKDTWMNVDYLKPVRRDDV